MFFSYPYKEPTNIIWIIKNYFMPSLAICASTQTTYAYNTLIQFLTSYG